MALIRWSPRSDTMLMDPFFSQVDDMFRDLTGTRSERAWYPALDLVEEKDRLVAHLELPGIDPKNVQINLQGDMLTISGTREDLVNTEKDGKVLKREHARGSFLRSVNLPYRVKAENVKASYANGIMTITMPKADEYVGRQIPVEIVK